MATTAEFFLPPSVDLDSWVAINFPGANVIEQEIESSGRVKITISQNLSQAQKDATQEKYAELYTKIVWT